jgi:hypothetical protein
MSWPNARRGIGRPTRRFPTLTGLGRDGGHYSIDEDFLSPEALERVPRIGGDGLLKELACLMEHTSVVGRQETAQRLGAAQTKVMRTDMPTSMGGARRLPRNDGRLACGAARDRAHRLGGDSGG